MKLVVIDMLWGVSMLDYYISEYVAISLDESLHTVGMIHFLNENDESNLTSKRLKYGQGGFVVESQTAGWHRLLKFIPSDATVVFWNPDIANVIKGVNNSMSKKRRLYNNKICVKDVYSMMSSCEKRVAPLTFSVAIDELKLTFDTDDWKEPRNRGKTMVRLIRKLINSGISVDGDDFKRYFLSGAKHKLEGKKYFDLDMKYHQRKRRELVLESLRDRFTNYDFDGSHITVSLPCAAYKVNFEADDTEIVYRRYDFSRGEKREHIILEGSDIGEKIAAIADAIELIEKRLSYGVGNSEITRLLQAIS